MRARWAIWTIAIFAALFGSIAYGDAEQVVICFDQGTSQAAIDQYMADCGISESQYSGLNDVYVVTVPATMTPTEVLDYFNALGEVVYAERNAPMGVPTPVGGELPLASGEMNDGEWSGIEVGFSLPEGEAATTGAPSTVIPEPATMTLVFAGLAALLGLRRRR